MLCPKCKEAMSEVEYRAYGKCINCVQAEKEKAKQRLPVRLHKDEIESWRLIIND